MRVKNIVFTGFMAAVMSGACASANAATDTTKILATQSYVDREVGNTNARVEFKENKVVGENYTSGSEVQYTSVSAAEAIASKAVKGVSDTVADYSEFTDKVNTLTGDASVQGSVQQQVSVVQNNLAEHIEEADALYATKDALQENVDNLSDSISANADAASKAQDAADAAQDAADAAQADATQALLDAASKAAAAQAAAEAYANSLASNYDAAGAAAAAQAAAEKAAQVYADSLASNYDKVGSAAAAQAAAEAAAIAYANSLASDYDAAGAAAAAEAAAKAYADKLAETTLALANKYTDSEIDKLAESLGGTSADLQDLSAKVETNTQNIQSNADKITAIETSEYATSGVTKGLLDSYRNSIADLQATDVEMSGAITTTLQSAKDYTDALANGAVATNTADIAVLNQDVEALKSDSENYLRDTMTTNGSYLVTKTGTDVTYSEIYIVNANGTQDLLSGKDLTKL